MPADGHVPAHQLDQRQLNRAFSACLHGDPLNSWGGLAPRPCHFEIACLMALRAATGLDAYDSVPLITKIHRA